jgi:hypothetical protein
LSLFFVRQALKPPFVRPGDVLPVLVMRKRMELRLELTVGCRAFALSEILKLRASVIYDFHRAATHFPFTRRTVLPLFLPSPTPT